MNQTKTTITLNKNDIELILQGLSERVDPKLDLLEDLENIDRDPVDENQYNQLKKDLKELRKLEERFKKKLEKLK